MKEEVSYSIKRIDDDKVFLVLLDDTRPCFAIIKKNDKSAYFDITSKVSMKNGDIILANTIYDQVLAAFQDEYIEITEGWVKIRDLNFFRCWNWNHWFDDDSASWNFKKDILPVLEEHRPITVYLDGSVYGVKDNYDECLHGGCKPYKAEELIRIWSMYGYPYSPPEFH